MNTQSPTAHTPSPRRRWLRAGAAAGIGALALTALVAGPAAANHRRGQPGRQQLRDRHRREPQGRRSTADPPSTSTGRASTRSDRPTRAERRPSDDSFGQGSKEDTVVPTVVDGSIPPNKSDLKNFGVYLEETAGDDFLHMFWHRVQDPTGTTNMDFEFNQSEEHLGQWRDARAHGWRPADPVRPRQRRHASRTVPLGVGHDRQQVPVRGGEQHSLLGHRVNLTASGDATGSINTTAIPAAESDGLGHYLGTHLRRGDRQLLGHSRTRHARRSAAPT